LGTLAADPAERPGHSGRTNLLPFEIFDEEIGAGFQRIEIAGQLDARLCCPPERATVGIGIPSLSGRGQEQ
jgi:hypothetical protein